MPLLRRAPSVIQIARDLGLSGNDPVRAILDHCLAKVELWVGEFRGTLTLSRLHQLVDDHLHLRHVVVTTDDQLDELIREHVAQNELVVATLRHEFATGTEAITFRLRHAKLGMRRNLSVIDGRGNRAVRVYFGKRHESSHLLSLTPTQLDLVFRRTHAQKNVAEEQLMDKIGGEIAFYRPLFKPELDRLQRRYGRPCFQLIEDLRAEVCPDASWYATGLATVEQNDVPALFLTASYAAKTADQGHPGASLALRASARGNAAARAAGLIIPWNYRIPAGSVIYDVFHSLSMPSEVHADERLGIWTASNGSRLRDLPIHVLVRRYGNQVVAIVTLN